MNGVSSYLFIEAEATSWKNTQKRPAIMIRELWKTNKI